GTGLLNCRSPVPFFAPGPKSTPSCNVLIATSARARPRHRTVAWPVAAQAQVAGAVRAVGGLGGQTEVAHNLGAACRAVQAVEVDSRDAVVQEPAADVGANLDADLPHRLVVARELLKAAAEVVAELGAAQRREAL